MTASVATDPASRSASSWASSQAALKGRGVPDSDPRIVECRAALAYWRCRTVIDRERGNLDPAHVPALADMLRHAHAGAAGVVGR
ncbi:hypothetical protein BVC93_24405 [Mycobacterium sp. MS1601]|uniref:hypothetical protein n=1 Tax=Mycobacterium sp. MS1601 TaxID=1936029 RepID=UPI0009796C09|nr:hypothetical protein [Mycobacterium sp. MS1601]AQA05025.1 hypothetical protein BVC93_24405 [Mycobacterium sp. MS1601]